MLLVNSTQYIIYNVNKNKAYSKEVKNIFRYYFCLQFLLTSKIQGVCSAIFTND